ncbi:probable G-protein coupled receptor 139 [Narcine bancroftii]|uniref:probable G-protein coupled receptor 139 n=1 Tax=Narcine bancroftii TaxID=1343680 RepID=UPI0038312177
MRIKAQGIPQISILFEGLPTKRGGTGFEEKMWEIYRKVDKILYVVISAFGIPVNLVAIVILSRKKCGLSSCTVRYLVAMAAADMLLIVTEVILSRLKYHYFPGTFLDITPICSAVLALRSAATDCSVWFTVTFTFDRFVVICCQKLKTKYCTEKTAAVVLATTGFLLCLKNVPMYFIYEKGEIIDNVFWWCAVKPSFFTESGWVGFDTFDVALTPSLAFIVILLCNALTVRYILVASRVRQGLTRQSNVAHRPDPETKSRRRSVILVLALSCSLIILWMTNIVDFFYYKSTGNGLDITDFSLILNNVGYLLRNVSCCTNTFIYVATQSRFREQVKNMVKYPVIALLQFIHEAKRSCQHYLHTLGNHLNQKYPRIIGNANQ